MKKSEKGMECRQHICLVDDEGRFIREEEKDIGHRGEGMLHSAFLVMVFNENNELMIARRSGRKKLWPHYWDGTVASHYINNKDALKTVSKRLDDEIGLSEKIVEWLFKFRYHARYMEIGSEHEICDVYAAKVAEGDKLSVDASEIEAHKFLTIRELESDLETSREEYTPWFHIAFKTYLEKNKKSMS